MNRASLTCLVGGVLALLALTSVGPADAPKAKENVKEQAKARSFVILVGIDQYADKQIKPRAHAEADAKALYDLFTDKEYFPADKKDVTLLLGKEDEKRGGKKATRKAFLDSLKDVTKNAGVNDTVVLGFIGQGGPLGESGDRRCYFLADSTFKGRDKDAVTSEEIEEAIKSLKAKKMCVLLDIDFKGFVDDGKAGRAISEPTLGKAPYREFLGDDGTDDHLPIAGRVAFLATNGLSTSIDLKEHGLFTHLVLTALKGGADTEGYEADGLVTVDELAKYLNKELPEQARKHGKTEKEKEQDHFVLSGISSHFVLTTNPAAMKTARERLEKFDKMAATGKITPEQVAEGRPLLERMPPLKRKQDLRKAYQQFIDGKLTSARFNAERKEIRAGMELPRRDAVAFANKVLEATEVVKEDYVRDVNVAQMAIWAVRELYSFLEEPIPEDIEKQLKEAKGFNERKLQLLLAEARLKLGNREDLENQKDLNVALQRAMHKLDPHTTYIDPETRKKFEREIAGNFTGIGIQIRKDAATEQLLVATPILGSPAYKAETPMSKADSKYARGLWAGDLITEIIRDVDSDGKPLAKTETTPTKGLALDKAVKLILGQEDTFVTLMVQREGIEKPFPVKIKRGMIEVESVLGVKRKTDDRWDFVIDRQNKIGYIRLNSFSRNSFKQIDEAMRELVNKEGIKGFVLDLRFNPGGLLDIAIKITDLYIDDGVIVSIHPREQEKAAKYFGRHRDSLLDFPMVCLVNGFSASGSEIVSAALQDHKRAVVFGERSYGKGSVQNIKDFDVADTKTGETLKAEIKLTTAAFRRPNGGNLNKSSTSGKEEEVWGVVPDKVIKLSAKERRDLMEHLRNVETIERPDRRGKEVKKEDAKPFADKQLDAALQYLRGQIKLTGKLPRKDNG